jgi:hypothetical protein
MKFIKKILVFFVAAICLVFVFALSFRAYAQKELSGNETLFVNLQNAKIQFVVGKGKEFKWKLSEGNPDSVQVSLRDSTISVTDKIYSRPVSLEFEMPSVPLELHLREGAVNVKNWRHSVMVEAAKAKVALVGLRTSAKVVLLRGEVVAQDTAGLLEFDLFDASLKVNKHNGDMVSHNFLGETLIEKSQGAFSLESSKGRMVVKESGGSLKFDVKKASLTTQNFKGRQEGQILDGVVSLNPEDESDVNVRSQKGKLTVVLPKNSAPFLNLSTEEGELFLPGKMKAYRDGSNKVYKGHARGSGSRGQVVARSNEGTIIVK